MFKTVMMIKRRPDLSREEFIRRYETQHSKLGERLLRGGATRYLRRYLTAVPNPITGALFDEPDHDVLMEAWFADRAAWEATMALLEVPEVLAEIISDEETLFDRSKIRMFVVDEYESDVS